MINPFGSFMIFPLVSDGNDENALDVCVYKHQSAILLLYFIFKKYILLYLLIYIFV